LKLDNKKRKGR